MLKLSCNVVLLSSAAMLLMLTSNAGGLPPCTGTLPGAANQNCGAQSKCENIKAGPFRCVGSRGWYYKNKGRTKCDGKNAGPNDNCTPTGQVVICVCKYYCTNPDPATGKCAKGNRYTVPVEIRGRMRDVQVCATETEKHEAPFCLGGS